MGAGRAEDRWRYWILLGVQTLGAALLYWHAVPLYRRVFADPAAYEARTENLLWALSSMALMQLGYWSSFRTRPPMPQLVQPVLGHVVLCLARFGFILASGVFTFVFLLPRPGLFLPPGRYVVLMFAMFSVFCYTLELERLGRALMGLTSRK